MSKQNQPIKNAFLQTFPQGFYVLLKCISTPYDKKTQIRVSTCTLHAVRVDTHILLMPSLSNIKFRKSQSCTICKIKSCTTSPAKRTTCKNRHPSEVTEFPNNCIFVVFWQLHMKKSNFVCIPTLSSEVPHIPRSMMIHFARFAKLRVPSSKKKGQTSTWRDKFAKSALKTCT